MTFATQYVPLASLLALVTATCVSLQLQPKFLFARAGNKPLQAAAGTDLKQSTLWPGNSGLDVRRSPFNAKCDWNGKTGTDDTLAFTAAAATASQVYFHTGKPVDLHIGPACKLSSTVVFGSGVHWVGPAPSMSRCRDMACSVRRTRMTYRCRT